MYNKNAKSFTVVDKENPTLHSLNPNYSVQKQNLNVASTKKLGAREQKLGDLNGTKQLKNASFMTPTTFKYKNKESETINFSMRKTLFNGNRKMEGTTQIGNLEQKLEILNANTSNENDEFEIEYAPPHLEQYGLQFDPIEAFDGDFEPNNILLHTKTNHYSESIHLPEYNFFDCNFKNPFLEIHSHSAYENENLEIFGDMNFEINTEPILFKNYSLMPKPKSINF
ncbi:hypothetical protein BB559_003989 [Furculomyces boomerangus]|uniref:Uncharacterized protein n=2 Tax=Harpellales TaxID=61421 RepID=A0A2T9YHE5_9FUNG|nr:hypothetical protein BB559_003989 [Furculomyces boomerangus]